MYSFGKRTIGAPGNMRVPGGTAPTFVGWYVCEKVHASEAAEDKSEILAKKRALENWVAHARRYGEDFARWGNAWERHFECSRTDSGLFRCKAVARPCAVRQVPPDGLKPLRRDPGT
jgi:hypothetical protein